MKRKQPTRSITKHNKQSQINNELNTLFSMIYTDQTRPVTENLSVLLCKIEPQTIEGIWDSLEEHRTSVEKLKLLIIRKKQGIIDVPNSTCTPSTQQSLIKYYSEVIKDAEQQIEKHKINIEILRSKLSEDILYAYDQEIIMLHLRA